MKRITALFASILMLSQVVFAQSTYQEVYNIFQANCTTGCHSGASPSANLDLGASEAEVYQALVDVTPLNPYAANTLKQKLIDPGYPERSYLLRKCNNGFDAELDLLDVAEGNSMPAGQPALADHEIEIIRQWVLWGAQETGTHVDADMIETYYTEGGIADIEKPLTPEEEGLEGYQVRFGPIFMAPGAEFEYVQIHQVQSDEEKEIIKMKGIMHPYSHHWVLRSFDPAFAEELGDAPVDAVSTAAQAFVFLHGKYMGVWMYSREMELPEGTAIFQDSAEVLLLNLHMPNYSQDSICKASVYHNIYTQDAGSGAVEMIADLQQYGGFDPWVLQIPPDGQEHTIPNAFTVPNETYYFWNIQGHTHQIGSDFDVFLRNPDGSKGEQIYEGFYDPDYNFNTGSYDYSHPPVRTWDEMYEVNMDWGLITEASYINSTSDTIGFGFTAEDEMHIMYYQYTTELPSVSINEMTKVDANISVYPNPASDVVSIDIKGDYQMKNAEITVFDIYGKHVFTSNGINGHQVRINRNGLSSGIYTFMISENNNLVANGKLVFR